MHESLQSAFCSSGLPIRKSVLGYFNAVVAVAFLAAVAVALPTKFENSMGRRFCTLIYAMFFCIFI